MLILLIILEAAYDDFSVQTALVEQNCYEM